MSGPYWVLHLPTRLTSLDAVTGLAVVLRDSLAHVDVLAFGEVTLSAEEHQLRRHRVWCDRPVGYGTRCPLRDRHVGSCVRPGGPGYSGRSQSTPSGGTRSAAEAGSPCQGRSSARTEPRLPTPDPP